MARRVGRQFVAGWVGKAADRRGAPASEQARFTDLRWIPSLVAMARRESPSENCNRPFFAQSSTLLHPSSLPDGWVRVGRHKAEVAEGGSLCERCYWVTIQRCRQRTLINVQSRRSGYKLRWLRRCASQCVFRARRAG